MDPESFHFALEENARKAGMSYDDYAAGLNLLDTKQIAAVLDSLHVAQRVHFPAESFYINEKGPFGFCYVDEDLDVTHEDDTMGDGLFAPNAPAPGSKPPHSCTATSPNTRSGHLQRVPICPSTQMPEQFPRLPKRPWFGPRQRASRRAMGMAPWIPRTPQPAPRWPSS